MKFWVDVVPDMGRPITAKFVKVFMNGRDVTTDCFYARLPRIPFLPVISYGEFFLLNEEGKRHLKDGYGEVATEKRTGIIWWKYRKDKPECVRYS